jgi:hypothetical protein
LILQGTQRNISKTSLSLDNDQHVGDRLPGETNAGFHAVRNLGSSDLALFLSPLVGPIYSSQCGEAGVRPKSGAEETLLGKGFLVG